VANKPGVGIPISGRNTPLRQHQTGNTVFQPGGPSGRVCFLNEAAAAATLPKFSDKVDSLAYNKQLDTNGLKTGPLPFILHAFSLCGQYDSDHV